MTIMGAQIPTCRSAWHDPCRFLDYTTHPREVDVRRQKAFCPLSAHRPRSTRVQLPLDETLAVPRPYNSPQTVGVAEASLNQTVDRCLRERAWAKVDLGAGTPFQSSRIPEE